MHHRRVGEVMIVTLIPFNDSLIRINPANTASSKGRRRAGSNWHHPDAYHELISDLPPVVGVEGRTKVWSSTTVDRCAMPQSLTLLHSLAPVEESTP